MTDSSSRARRAPSVSQVHSEQVEVGHYLVLPHVMGKGAWSVVHAAIDTTKEANATSSKGGSGSLTSLDQSNAVAKIISKASLREKRSLTEGEELREISIMRSMPRHSNLVRMLDTFETEHFYYIFLEKLPNGDLCDYILNTPTGKLPEAQCRKFLRQIVTGLSALHNAGIAHRDVKPENMLLDAEDELRITDFGLAKRHTRSRDIVSVPEEMSRELVGTLRYAAPEMFVAQFHGVPYDAFISDVWSVGVCLYIMFTGSFPYSAGADADERQTYDVLRNSDLVLPTEISRDGVNLVKKLLCKDPRARIRLHDVERHPWMRSSTAEAAEEPLTDDHTPVDFTDVSQLQTELQRQKEMIRELREELTKERGARERLEKLVREYERNASYMTPNSTSRRGVTPTRPLRSSMAPNNVARTNSPQRLPNSVTTPMRNSPKRPHGVTSSILQSQGVGAPSIPARMATASPTRKMLHSTLAARGTQLPTNSPGRSGVTMSGRLVSSGVRQNLSRASPVTRFGTPVGSRHNSATIYSGRTATPTRSGGMSRRGTSTARADLSSNTTNDPLQIGQEVHYKGGRAVVRFYGPTSFAEGIWIGLELELPNGLNDGSCFIDQKRYFTCPEGHGVFVRKSQITL